MAASADVASFLAISIQNGYLSLRDLVLCFETCTAWKHELKSRGFDFVSAWLCATLAGGKNPQELACRIRELHPCDPLCRLNVLDQVVRFLLRQVLAKALAEPWYGRREADEGDQERYWAQLASQEPDGSCLAEGIRIMQWIWKGPFMHQRFGKPGYSSCVAAMPKNTDEADVLIVCVSPDGKVFAQCVERCTSLTQATAEEDSEQACSSAVDISIHELSSGLEIRSALRVSGGVTAMAFSPDGKLLAVVDYGVVKVIGESGDTICNIEAQVEGDDDCGEWTRFITWTKDSNYIIVGSSAEEESMYGSEVRSQVRIWDRSGNQRLVVKHESRMTCMATSPDGSTLASGSSEGALKLTNLIPLTLDPHQPEENCETKEIGCWSPECVAWSHDSMLMAVGQRYGGVCIRNRKGELLVVWGSHGEENPQCLCTSQHGALRERGFNSHKPCPVVGPPFNHISALAFTPDGKVLACYNAAGDDAGYTPKDVIRLWDVMQQREIGYVPESCFRGRFGGPESVKNMFFLPDLTLIVVQGRQVTTWDVQECTQGGKAAQWHEFRVHSIDMSLDCQLVATCCTHAWVRWERIRSNPVTKEECTVTLWDLRTGQIVRTLQAQDQPVIHVLFNHNGSTLASSDYDSLTLWSNFLGQDVRNTTLKAPGTYMSWSPGGSTIACADPRTPVFIVSTAGSVVSKLEFLQQQRAQRANAVSGLSWLSDGKRLAITYSDMSMCIINTATRCIEKEFARICTEVYGDIGLSAMSVGSCSIFSFRCVIVPNLNANRIAGLVTILDSNACDEILLQSTPIEHYYTKTWAKKTLHADTTKARRDVYSAIHVGVPCDRNCIHLVEISRQNNGGKRTLVRREVATLDVGWSDLGCISCAGGYVVAAIQDEKVQTMYMHV
jgi:WD40 repeat protein